MIVIEAAGNGGENLDHKYYKRKFDRTKRDSGAIMIGAGGPPRDGWSDRERLDFSNYGARVDVQGWGRKVATLDYGDLQRCDADDATDRHYTDEFSGTSSASPIVAGAAVLVQGLAKKRGKVLTPRSSAICSRRPARRRRATRRSRSGRAPTSRARSKACEHLQSRALPRRASLRRSATWRPEDAGQSGRLAPPYVVHVVSVTAKVIAVLPTSIDADLAVACALLHDTVEDTAESRAEKAALGDDIEQAFGRDVRDGVWALSKFKTLARRHGARQARADRRQPAPHSRAAACRVGGQARGIDHQPRATAEQVGSGEVRALPSRGAADPRHPRCRLPATRELPAGAARGVPRLVESIKISQLVGEPVEGRPHEETHQRRVPLVVRCPHRLCVRRRTTTSSRRSSSPTMSPAWSARIRIARDCRRSSSRTMWSASSSTTLARSPPQTGASPTCSSAAATRSRAVFCGEDGRSLVDGRLRVRLRRRRLTSAIREDGC